MVKVSQWIKQKMKVAPVLAQTTDGHHCLIVGEDRNTKQQILESTGEFILNERNDLGYDVNPDTVRTLVKFGVRNFSAPHSILYETSGAPFNFKTGRFDADESSTAQILKDGRTHAQTQAVIYIEKEEQQSKLGLALTILCTGFAIMCIVLVV